MTDLDRYHIAASKYKPDRVKLLWIAHAPPKGGNRYFYFETMSEHPGDSLFREVMRAMARAMGFPDLDIHGGDSKVPFLQRFQAFGCFLIDVCKDPSYACMEYWWPTIRQEICTLNPRRILLVKADVCRFVKPKLCDMNMYDRLLTTEDVPFPGSGQQTRFHQKVDPLLRELYGECDCWRVNKDARAGDTLLPNT